MQIKIAQVFVVDGIPDYKTILQKAGLDVEVKIAMSVTEEAIIETARDADVLIGVGSLQPFSKKVIESLSRCRYIASMGIGYDKIDIRTASERSILVSNVPDYCWEEVSDHVMALILSGTRRIVQLNDEVKRGEWKVEPDPDIQKRVWPHMSRLRGQTLGIIGFGGVSRALLPKARGFGLTITAYDPYVDDETFKQCGVEAVRDLHHLLSVSDIVVLNTNLTDETRHMIGAEEFKKMKKNASVVNASRGAVIDMEALYQALKTGDIAFAGLDVTDPEPFHRDHPLLGLDNCVVTAHSAHFSPYAWSSLLRRPAEEIIRLLVEGKDPKGLLNPEIKEAYIKKWGSFSIT